MTILLISNALLVLFLRRTRPSVEGGIELDRGVGLGEVEGVDDDEPVVGNDKLLARFRS